MGLVYGRKAAFRLNVIIDEKATHYCCKSVTAVSDFYCGLSESCSKLALALAGAVQLDTERHYATPKSLKKRQSSLAYPLKSIGYAHSLSFVVIQLAAFFGDDGFRGVGNEPFIA